MEMTNTPRWLVAIATVLCALPAPIQPRNPDATRCFDDGRGVRALTADQLRIVNRGEAAVATADLPNRRWPRVCVFQFIAAPPEASLAVLVDYPLRPSYLPEVRRSNVVPPTTDSLVKTVAYVVHVLLGMNETDTLREVVRTVDRPATGGYQLEWTGLTSSMAQSIRGSATFVPWHNDSSNVSGTLLIYDQTVEPGSRLASLPFIKNRGIDAVRNTARAIAQQVETELAQRPQQLDTQVSGLRRTLTLRPQ